MAPILRSDQQKFSRMECAKKKKEFLKCSPTVPISPARGLLFKTFLLFTPIARDKMRENRRCENGINNWRLEKPMPRGLKFLNREKRYFSSPIRYILRPCRALLCGQSNHITEMRFLGLQWGPLVKEEKRKGGPPSIKYASIEKKNTYSQNLKFLTTPVSPPAFLCVIKRSLLFPV